MPLLRERRLKVAFLELGLKLDEGYARSLARSAPARYLRTLTGRGNGANGAASNGHTAESANPYPTTQRLDVDSYPTAEARAIADRVNTVRDWYHVLDLPHGVTTPGRADHRADVARYGLPEDMTGMRCLDVATFDGFWAFEMERRGAEVVAVDLASWFEIDLPLRLKEKLSPEENFALGDGFRLAKDILGSRVERREVSVYNLDPGELGTFDVVFMSDLLLHLRDPQRALEKLYTVTRPDGYAIIAEPYNPDLEQYANIGLSQFAAFVNYVWWIPSSLTLKCMLQVAGFDPVEEISRLKLNYRHPFPVQKVVLKARPAIAAASGR